MKTITILQPYASLIACGTKKIETRSWTTKYQGPITIHAGQGKQNIDLCKQKIFWATLWSYEIAARPPVGWVVMILRENNKIRKAY
jgi:hypothetical protein